MTFNLVLALTILTTSCSFVSTGALANEMRTVNNIASWKDLTPSDRLVNTEGLQYFEFKTENGSNVFLLVVDLQDKHLAIKPVVNKPTASTTAAAERVNALASVNLSLIHI